MQAEPTHRGGLPRRHRGDIPNSAGTLVTAMSSYEEGRWLVHTGSDVPRPESSHGVAKHYWSGEEHGLSWLTA